MTLLDAGSGSHVVAGLALGDRSVRRLAELGVRLGSVVEVVHRTSGGGVVLGVAGSRVALDRRTAASIDVEVSA